MITKKLRLVSLTLFSFLPTLLILSGFINISQAASTSSANVSALCQVTQGGGVSWPGSDGKCPTGAKTIVPVGLPSTFSGLCLVGRLNQADAIYNAVNTAGQISCDQYQNDPNNYDVRLIKRAEVSGSPATTTTVTPVTPTTPTTKTGTSTKSNTSKNSTKSSGSTVNDAGGCPTGFTSKGPLCIPNNPWGGSNGIAGKGTVGELATTIISILLGMAGIVAVIMVIIGGYHIMTARGNETQQTNGRKTLTNALIGLAIVIVSYALVQAITNYLTTKT